MNDLSQGERTAGKKVWTSPALISIYCVCYNVIHSLWRGLSSHTGSIRILRGSSRVLLTTWVRTGYCGAHGRMAPISLIPNFQLYLMFVLSNICVVWKKKEKVVKPQKLSPFLIYLYNQMDREYFFLKGQFTNIQSTLLKGTVLKHSTLLKGAVLKHSTLLKGTVLKHSTLLKGTVLKHSTLLKGTVLKHSTLPI